MIPVFAQAGNVHYLLARIERSDVALSVPNSAVFTEDGKSYVFTAKTDRRFERRLIVAVPDAEGRLRVTSGLRVGDRIVTDGAMLVDYRRKLR